MKSIECFKFKNTNKFEKCLSDYGYGIYDVKGFEVSSVDRYRGNILKTYKVYVFDGESVYFSVVYFKSFNEYRQSALGFNGDRMLDWYQDSIIRLYKAKDIWATGDRYVIVSK